MCEAKRRKLTIKTPPNIEQLNDHFADMHDAGQGVYRLELINRLGITKGVLGLLTGVEVTDRDKAILNATRKLVEGIAGGSWTPACLLCDHEFSASSMPETFVFLMPEIEFADFSKAMMNCVCVHCSREPDLNKRVMDFYRANVMPNMRPITPMVGATGSA